MLEALTEDIAAVAARGGLQKLPGIGKDLAVRVEEFLHTGRIDQLEAMRRDVPPRFLTLLEIRGLGPRTAKLLWDRLGVDSVERLEELGRTKEILNVPGIREKTCENILKGIAIWRAGRTRTLLPAARAVAEQVASALRSHGGVERLEVAGSLRRMRETVKDVDILVTSTEPARVIDTLTSLPSVIEVIARGDTKVSVRHQDGLQVDLRVVEPAAFGAALQYFTGSRDHNVRVRELAKRRGLTISEYGVFEEKSGKRVAGETEEEGYATVGLPWIPPELRENAGELDIVLAAVHSRFKQTREEMTTRIVRALGHPKVHVLAHPTGRLLGSRDPYDVDMEAVFAAAQQHGKALEINASPERLDLADVHARRAAELGIPIAINTDTHYLTNFDNLALGVAVARRAWIGPSQVLNARPLAELVGWTQRARSA